MLYDVLDAELSLSPFSRHPKRVFVYIGSHIVALS